ncbi:MAG: hypothetical protein OHK93_002472 [Ramalina farinacea]|uniref:Uncharacterized protein n=1 Tax=Ramalina farinacea TaxID=258253 RepID=A0AA43QRF7_9LECA|nr:hypothetical protein [Ramalina farinacea]
MSAPFRMKSSAEEVSCGGDSDCEITLTYNNRRFVVLLSREPSLPSNAPDSIECTYPRKLDSALESKDPRKLTTITDKVFGFLATLPQPISQEFASLTGDEPEILDIESCMNPETYKLQMITVDEKPKVARRNDNGSSSTIHSKFFSSDVRTVAGDL